MVNPMHAPPSPLPVPPSGGQPAVPEGFEAFERGGPYMALNGPLYRRERDGAFALGLRVERRHVNPMANLHGGMMASFCDMLLVLVAHRQSEALRAHFMPTVSLQLDYLAPAPLGCWIEGTGQLLRATRSLAFVQALVTADGQPCVRASGVLKIGPLIPVDDTL